MNRWITAGAVWMLALGLRAEEPSRHLQLPEAIASALAQNRELVRAALGVRSAAAGIRTAEAAFGYRLEPEGRSEADQDGHLAQAGLSASRTFTPGTELTAGARYSERGYDASEGTRQATYRVELSQPLFRNFGALVQTEPITRATQQLRAAERDYEQQKADLVVEVASQFETILQLERQIEADEAAFLRMDKLYRLTRARERQGRATRVDSLRVELQRGQAESRLANSREKLALTRRDFAELIGLEPDTAFTLEPAPLLALDPPPPREAVRIAMSNRLDYAQTLQDYADSARAARIAERSLWPAITLQSRFEHVDDLDEAGGEDRWSIGLSGDTELLRTAERARLGQAVLSREAALQTIRIRELSIARDVQQQLSAYQRTRLDLTISGRNTRVAEARARLARRMFERGRGDNFAVTDAEQAWTDAQIRELAARAEASIASYRLLNSLGTLVETPAHLRPEVPALP